MAGHVARIGVMQNAYKTFIWKPEENTQKI
jgi:hypothetical protein